MMRKELVNKKVVRAIALGLSAVMLTTPMTAMAAEGEDPVDGDELKEVDVKEDSKYEAAEDAVEAAQDSTTDGGTIVLEESATLPSGTVINTVPDAEDAAGADALKDVTATVDGKTVDYTDVAADENEANKELTDAEVGLIQTDTSEAAAEVDINEANDITTEIENNNAEIEAAGQVVSDAADAAEEAAVEADKATTEAEVQAAADKAAQAVAEAEEAQAKAQASYEENLIKLDAAKAELDAAKANLDAAKASLTATKADVAEAEAKVAEAEAKATALKAEVDKEEETIKTSQEGLLKAAYDNMMAQKSVNNLYEDYGKDEDNDGIGDEWLDEFGVEGAGSGYWSAADAYFELYLKYVYGDSYVSGGWTKNKNTLNNGLEYDAERDNIFTVTYKVKDADGNFIIDEKTGEALQETIDYNYHTADKAGNIYIYEKEVAIEKVDAVTKEETVNVGLSIKNEGENNEVTYTKYEEKKKDTDVVVSVAKDEKGNDTSILVKDDDSKLLDSEDIVLSDNQAINDASKTEEYTKGTTTVYTYGTKEVQVDYADKIGRYSNLLKKLEEFENKYSSDEYRVEIVFDHGFGNDEVITLEEAKELWLGSSLGAWLDCGYELNVYQTVEDKDNIVDQKEVDCIVKTTYADVVTTKLNKFSDVCGDKDRAKKAAKAKAEELGLKDGEYTVEYETVWDGPFDKDCKYTIKYNTTSTEKQVIKTESYTATAYENNSYTKTVEVEAAKDVEYWTERKNTTNDAKVKAAIDGITEKLNIVKTKQDAAAIALIAAQEAKKDVDAAKAELDKLSVDDAAYQTALTKYNDAAADFEMAKKTLEDINEDVKDAQQNYNDAVEEFDRFADDESDDSDDDDTTPVVTPVPTPVVLVDAPVAPVAVVTPAAAPAVVDIDDEATPLAGGIGDGDGNGNGDAEGGEGEVIVAGAEEEVEPAIVAIEDEETPLAAGVSADGKMSWWWLLIIALLGATGYKMYKDHQKKKEEAAQEV